jgi:predicted transposase YbfD/YdcC
VVLGQVDVDTKTNEIPMFTTLLDRVDITDAVITADALHAQRSHARYLAGRGAHYLLIVKRNQPGLHAQLAALPWPDVPVAYTKAERGHGRTERRTLKITSVAAGLAFPRAARAIRITRRRKVKGKWSAGTCYAVTSLTVTQASPARLAAILRGRWGIEDRLHWIRDMAFDEDRSQVRTASGPRTMASLRNLVITILRLAGTTSIAAALRYHARRPSRPLQTIMKVLTLQPHFVCETPAWWRDMRAAAERSCVMRGLAEGSVLGGNVLGTVQA